MHLAERDPGVVEQVRDHARLDPGVAFDRLQSLNDGLRQITLAAENRRPTEDRIQRIAQFVRQSGQEFLLEPIAALRLGTCGPLAREQTLPRRLRLQLMRYVGRDQDAASGDALLRDLPLDLNGRSILAWKGESS